MLYPPEITEPIRLDLINAGVSELRTPADVDMVLKNTPGTTSRVQASSWLPPGPTPQGRHSFVAVSQ